MKLINKYANSRYSKMNEYYCGITTELDKLAGLDPNGHWKHYVLCDYEDGCLPIRIPGGTLGSIEYDECEKYFEKVETPVKRTWSEWSDYHILHLTDLLGIPRNLGWQYRYNGKKIQVRSGAFKVETTCYKDDTFDLSKGLNLAKKRLIVKYLDNQVKSIAKVMKKEKITE